MTQTAPKPQTAKRSQTTAKPKETSPPTPVADMEELWNTAQTYGRTRIYSHDDGTVACHIEMINAQGIKLTAESDYNITKVTDAIQDAIVNARKVRGVHLK